MNSPLDKPKRLYKYQPITLQTLENIKQQIIYFGSPSNFNDPYDCALQPNVQDLSNDDIELLRSIYLKSKVMLDDVRLNLEEMDRAELGNIFFNEGRSAIYQKIEMFNRENGVSCFSERNDNLLMWSHYAGSHSGVCLEFDTSNEPFSKLQEVDYREEMPAINIVNALYGTDKNEILKLFTTKSLDWRYEREWRVLHKVVGTKFCYESKALTGVYFGPKISPSAIEIICLILKGQNEHVQFWRGERSTKSFSVEFSPITYTSNIDARNAGLL